MPASPPPVVYDAGGILGGEYARSFGALLGISSIHAGPLALISQAHRRLLVQPSAAALEAFGVWYVLAPAAKCDAVRRRIAWPVEERSDEDCVLRNPKPPPRYELVNDARLVDSPEAMAKLAWEQPRPIPVVAPETIGRALKPGLAQVTSYSPGHVQLHTATSATGLLLVRESFAPGWQARVDGRRVETYPAAGIFFAIAVEPGAHLIELDYRAPGLRLGAVIAAGWTVIAIVAAWWSRRADARRQDEVLGGKPMH